MTGPSERAFAAPGSALLLLALALSGAALQSARGAVACVVSIFNGAAANPLPSVIDVVAGLFALVAAGLFLRHLDDNAQALATGPSVLPPLPLLRLVQPRLEHPLRELWSRSDPQWPEDPMPRSRVFGALCAVGLAIAIPSMTFALIAPGSERLVLLMLDGAHHVALVGACLAALHFAAMLAARQEAAWERVRPSVIPVPLRQIAQRKPEGPAPAKAAVPPAPIATRVAEQPVEQSQPQPSPEQAPLTLPRACVVCKAALTGRRCEQCGAPALAGPFLILRALGGSGARRTFLAKAPDGRLVVVKELSFANAPDAQALEAFAREARMLREVRHPRVPVYVDAFREEEGPRSRLFLAYRYLNGVSLLQEMEERRYTEDEVLDLVEEVLEILRYLHGLQPPIIHRDLKPANLVRRSDGKIALIDFGVARDLDRTLHSATMVGTVGYMPPEQLAGQVDLTCDLYALGATALHLLVRRPPWEFMDGPELRLPPLKTAPTARLLLRRMLAPRRAQRFSSAREALAALRRLRAGGSAVPWKAWAAAGAGALTLVAAVLGTQRRLEAPDRVTMAQAVAPAPAQRPVPLPVRTSSVAPVAPTAAAVATWLGGKLTRPEVEANVRELPPWLKTSKPWWIQHHVLALVRRKLLVAEAQRRGLSPPIPQSATNMERERLLARALLEIESRDEGEQQPSKALRRIWERTTNALLDGADLQVDERQMFEIQPDRLFASAPQYRPTDGIRRTLEFYSRTGPCVVEIDPGRRRYGGFCEGYRTLSEALLEPETLQIADLTPGSGGFYAQLNDDFIESRRTHGDLLEAARLAEESMVRADVRLAEFTGTISPWRAANVLALAKPALQRCLALALFDARHEPDRATVRLRIELAADGNARSVVESVPAIPADACAKVLARPEIGGAGVLTFVAELERRP